MLLRILAVLAGTLVAAILVSPVDAQPTSDDQGQSSHTHSSDSHDSDHEDEPVAQGPSEGTDERSLPDPYGRARGPASDVQLPDGLRSCRIHSDMIRGGPTLREHYGLSDTVNLAEASIERPGMLVTREEAAQLDAADKTRETVDASELDELFDGPTFLGHRWDPATSRFTVYLTVSEGTTREDAAVRHQLETAKMVERMGENAPIDVVLVESSSSASEVRQQLNGFVKALQDTDRSGSVQGSLDITCGRVLVVVEEAEDLPSVEKLVRQGGNTFAVVLAPELAEKDADRYDHKHNDQDGGLGLRPYDDPSTTYLGDCTSSIGFYSTSGSVEYAVTAAHCLRGNALHSTNVLNQCDTRFVQGGYYISGPGACVRYQLGGSLDVAVVVKYSWEQGDRKAMIHGGNHTFTSIPGWQSARSNSSIGDQFCHSGRNWAGSPCGVLQSVNHFVCQSTSATGTPAHCVSNMFTTSMPGVGGDSGATVWSTNGGINRYAGVLKTDAGTFSHIQDIRSQIGLGGPVF